MMPLFSGFDGPSSLIGFLNNLSSLAKLSLFLRNRIAFSCCCNFIKLCSMIMRTQKCLVPPWLLCHLALFLSLLVLLVVFSHGRRIASRELDEKFAAGQQHPPPSTEAYIGSTVDARTSVRRLDTNYLFGDFKRQVPQGPNPLHN